MLSKQAIKDLEKLKQAGLAEKAKNLAFILQDDPFQNPPPFEKLIGDLNGYFLRRINIQHRLVYEVLKQENIVKILRMWSHYE
jgi:toxin YoeB